MMLDGYSIFVGRRAMYSGSEITATAIPIRIRCSYVREHWLAGVVDQLSEKLVRTQRSIRIYSGKA